MRSYSKTQNEDPSFIHELDLFVTGTDMDGKVATQLDDAGHIIEVKNHRSVFHLKFREPRKNPFDTKRNPEAVTAFRECHRFIFEFIDPLGPSGTGARGRFLGRPADSEIERICYVGAHPDRHLHRKQRAS